MGGKFNTDQLEKVVRSAVTIEASVLWARDIIKEGGLGKLVKLTGVVVHAIPAATTLVGVDYTEFKNEVGELDADDTTKIIAAFKAQLATEGQTTGVADDIAAVLSLVSRTVTMVQEWVTEVKALLAKYGINL